MLLKLDGRHFVERIPPPAASSRCANPNRNP